MVKTMQEHDTPEPTPVGMKFDSEKPMMNLVDYSHVEDIAKVLTYGAKKYGPESWKQVPAAEERYFAALMRHITAWRDGEINDPESGLPHLAHIATNVMFLSWFERRDNKK